MYIKIFISSYLDYSLCIAKTKQKAVVIKRALNVRLVSQKAYNILNYKAWNWEQCKQCEQYWCIKNPFVGPSEMMFSQQIRCEIINIITHSIIWANQKTKSFVYCWLHAHACNVWHKVLSRICRNNRRYFKHYVDTLIARLGDEATHSSTHQFHRGLRIWVILVSPQHKTTSLSSLNMNDKWQYWNILLWYIFVNRTQNKYRKLLSKIYPNPYKKWNFNKISICYFLHTSCKWNRSQCYETTSYQKCSLFIKKLIKVVLSNILVTACLIGHLLESKFRSHEHNVRSHDTMLYYLLLQLMKSLHLDRGNRTHGNIHKKSSHSLLQFGLCWS